MLNPISTRLKELDLKNPEERFIYQTMDLSLIRNRIIDSGLFEKGAILSIIDNILLDWEWLYEIGLSLSINPKDKMNDNQIQRYEEFSIRLGEFETYIQANRNLVWNDIHLLD